MARAARTRKTAADADLTDAQKRDPVEWVKFYWEQSSDADPHPFLAMSSILRVHALMTTTLEAELKTYELALSDYLMLKTLELSDDGTRLLSRVARHLLVHPTTVTLISDRLEKRGLLKRQPHPHDRRATLVSITTKGRKVNADATRALEQVDYGLPGLSPAKVKQLVSSLAYVRNQAGDEDRVHRESR
ncbi:MarR family transcriptional regulator [Mycolicibacterium neoaurum]|uniref:MarR family winged helix-turn-helix transcriptional regulator n=1 Tax=Mycolicibacterium neoaurum TaxID=1795 RepID=UPI002670FE23|nr:MarR family transcriptional regulator [Mycolicibacterium neoaurum]MDO3402719.1 MarR family transcriptional regulator [Mycolicibacterium neoaurum]